MSVKYNIVARGNPSDAAAPAKYYPSIVHTGETSLRQLSQKISAISTVSSIDTMAVLEAFLQVLPAELADGNIVRLGDFGNFWLRTKSDGSATPEAVSERNIKSVKPNFSPGKEFSQEINSIDFRKKSGVVS